MVSRADRLGVALEQLQSAKDIVDELQDEMQSWYDNMPDNLQGGEKADRIQTCADELSTLADDIDNALSSGESIEFVGMMG